MNLLHKFLCIQFDKKEQNGREFDCKFGGVKN